MQEKPEGMEVATLSPVPSPSHLARLDLSSFLAPRVTLPVTLALGNHRYNLCQLTGNREVDITVELFILDLYGIADLL